MHRLLNKYLFLFNVGGLLYVLIELIWRGWSHWTMFILGGLCFIYLGLFNEVLRWDTPLWQQILIGAVGITALEFCIPRVAGVNLCYLYPQAFAVRILHVVRVNLVRSILSGL